VQRASVAAWSDEEHVRELRARYARKRALLAPLLELAPGSSVATFYLWFRVPDRETSQEFATRLLEHGVVVAPGSYFGPSGEGYARLALVPSLAECERAAAILEEVL
jgi:acetylornithine aminotransferase